MKRAQMNPAPGGQYTSGPGTDSSSFFAAGNTLAMADYPEGSTDSLPAVQVGATVAPSGRSGFTGNSTALNTYVLGEQTSFLNLAWSIGLGRYNRGALVNLCCWAIGVVLGGFNALRWQAVMTNASFYTNAQVTQTILSNLGWHAVGDTQQGSAVIRNIKFVPNLDLLEYAGRTDSLGRTLVPCTLYQHNNSGNDIVAGTTITAFDGTTFTMADAALSSNTSCDFSLGKTAPAANLPTLQSTFRSNFQVNFVGDVTAGDKVIRNLKMDFTRLGINPSSTISETSNGGADIPNHLNPAGMTIPLRVGDYTWDGTHGRVRMIDGTTGVDAGALANNTGQTFSVDTTMGIVTFTADTTLNSPWLTNVSINPITCCTLPTEDVTGSGKGAGWHHSQNDKNGNAFAGGTRVKSVDSTTQITMNANALLTLTGTLIEFSYAQTSLTLTTFLYGTLVDLMTWGYDKTFGAIAIKLKTALALLDRQGNVLMDSTGLWAGGLPYAADTGASDAYAITLARIPNNAGMPIYFKANTANTGAATLSVNNETARSIVKGVSTALADNDILAGMICHVVRDANNRYVLMNPRSL